jgi:hypothetical protein
VNRPVSRVVFALLLLTAVATAPFASRGVDAQTRFMYLRGQSIHPAFEGWWPNDDGSFTLWFGYMNSNWEEEFDLPVGPSNYFSSAAPNALDDLTVGAFDAATADHGQPAHFYPRRNPFLFTVVVPADFGEQEVVWTLTSHGRTNRAFATLSADYRMDPQVMSTEVGGAFGSLDDRLRTNMPPDLSVEGGMNRSVKVGEPLTLIASATDPDDFPPRSDRGQLPKDLDEFYTTAGVGSSVVSSAPGVRLSWIVFRGPADHATFEPVQMKAWMDTRVWGNSPWSPPYILPEPPAGNRWEDTVTFDQPGEYTLRAVASDGARFTYENVTVQVAP